MTHPIYESIQLSAKSLAQLKQIYSEIGCTTEITDKRRRENWIIAILNHQSNQLEKVEPKTCTTCPLFKPFNDGTGRGLCCGSDQVSRDHHPQTGDCGHMIEAASNSEANLPQGQEFKHYAEGYIHNGEAWIDIYKDSCLQVCEKLFVYFPQGQADNLSVNLRQGQKAASNLTANLPEGQQRKVSLSVPSSSLTYKPTDHGVGTYEVWDGTEKYGTITMMVDGRWTHSIAPITYGTPYEAAGALIEATEAMQSFSKDIEVDSDYDLDFGIMYRVWKGWELLGTFYRAIDGQWVAQPCQSEQRPRCNTAYIAQLSILALAGLLVVNKENDAKLDKPFDELTETEWQQIKQPELAVA